MYSHNAKAETKRDTECFTATITLTQPFKPRTDHDVDDLDTSPAVMRCRAGSVSYRSKPGNMCKIMQITRLPPGNLNKVIQIRKAIFRERSRWLDYVGMDNMIQIMNPSALKCLGHYVGSDYLSDVRVFFLLFLHVVACLPSEISRSLCGDRFLCPACAMFSLPSLGVRGVPTFGKI